MDSIPPLPVGEVQKVAKQDTPCRKCGQNLRGLPIEGSCPQCGTAVGLSTHPELLRYADARFLEKLQRGLALLVGGIGAVIMATVLLIAASMAAGEGSNMTIPIAVLGLLMLAGHLAIIAGSWLVTTRDPSVARKADGLTAQQFIALALVIGLASVIIDVGSMLFPPSAKSATTCQAWSMVAGLAGIVGLLVQLHYVSRLALRLSDQDLADRFTSVALGLGLCYGIIVAATLAAIFFVGPDGAEALWYVMRGAGVLMAIVGVMYLLTLDRMRQAVAKQAALPRQSLAGIPDPGQSAAPADAVAPLPLPVVPVAEMPAAYAFDAQADAPATVPQDLPCRKCGRNVQGLPVDGRCPECGTPVAVAMHGNLLRYADPAYVNSLGLGFSLIVGGLCAYIIGVIVFALVDARIVVRMDEAGRAMLVAVFGVVALAAYGAIVVGSWLISAPDPSGIRETDHAIARNLIRIALIAGLCSLAIHVAALAIAPPPSLLALVQLVGGLALLAGIVGFVAQIYYVGKLAWRIPDQKLAERARFLAYAIPIAYGVVILTIILLAVSTGGGRRPATSTACFSSLALIALLVFAGMYLMLLDKMRLRMKEQAALAVQYGSSPAGRDAMPAA